MKTFRVWYENRRSIFTIGIWILVILGSMTNVLAERFRLVKDINLGDGSSSISYMNGNKQLFFWAKENEYTDFQLWTLDNAYGGVIKISHIDYDLYNHTGGYKELTVGVYRFFVLRRNSDGGHELWVGTSSGIKKLKDIPDYIIATEKVTALNKYFFVPFSDSKYGKELWVSDGTTLGTYMVKDIKLGTTSSNPHTLTEVDGKLYFMVGDTLWESDGTYNNTKLVRNFECDTCISSAHLMAVVNNTLYIRWSKRINGVTTQELWRYETTSGETLKVNAFSNLPEGVSEYAGVGNTLYFLNNTTDTLYGLWKTDGTTNGTVLLKEWHGRVGHISGSLISAENLLYFHGGEDENRELWVSNGTSSGTYQVKDISGSSDSGSHLTCLTALKSTLFFTHGTSTYLGDLWISNGSTLGTVKSDFTVNLFKCPAVSNGKFYFYGKDKTVPDNEGYGGELYSYSSSETLPSIIMYLLN